MARTVLVVDDHPGFRTAARRLLECEGYRVIGEAADGAQAVSATRELGPELALVDVYLPDHNGFEVAERLAELPAPPEVVLTSSHERAEIEHLLGDTPARGFLAKDQLSRAAIEALLADGTENRTG